MSKLRDAAQKALEALEPYADIKPRDWKTDREKLWRSYDVLRAALAEPDHIPDAGKMVAEPCEMGAMCLNCQPRGPNGECPDAPQPRRRLTDEEIAVIYLDTAEETSGGGLRPGTRHSARVAGS